MRKTVKEITALFGKLARFVVLSCAPGLLFFSAQVVAEPLVDIELSRETLPLVTIAVSAFVPKDEASAKVAWLATGRDILENDLRLSDLFKPEKPSVFEALAAREKGDPGKIDYNAWSSLKIHWVIKTEYQVNPKNNEVSFAFRLFDAVNERFVIGKRYQGEISLLRKTMHRFADEAVEQLTGKRGVAETRIAFVSEVERKDAEKTRDKRRAKEIFLVDFDGQDITRLTNEESIALSPAWSPDGGRLAFTSYAQRNPDLMMMDVTKKRRWPVLSLPGLNAAPAWAPDGARIALALSRDQNSEIYILTQDFKLTRLTNHFNIDMSPNWSPDGKSIAFTSDRSGTGSPQIYVMDAEAGDKKELKRVSFDTAYNDNPVWSPDGEKIAYTARVGKVFQIRIYDLKSKKTEDFTSGAGSNEEPSWSPDGRFVVYRHTDGKSENLFVKRVGGGAPRQLTFLSGGGVHPAWSPYLKK